MYAFTGAIKSVEGLNLKAIFFITLLASTLLIAPKGAGAGLC